MGWHVGLASPLDSSVADTRLLLQLPLAVGVHYICVVRDVLGSPLSCAMVDTACCARCGLAPRTVLGGRVLRLHLSPAPPSILYSREYGIVHPIWKVSAIRSALLT